MSYLEPEAEAGQSDAADADERIRELRELVGLGEVSVRDVLGLGHILRNRRERKVHGAKA